MTPHGMLMLALMTGLQGVASAQANGGAVMRFTIDRPVGAGLPQYAVVMNEAGNGSYFAGPPGADAETQTTDAMPIHAGPAAVKILFAARRTVLSGHCESRHKVAATGVKTLQVLSGDRAGQCTFNYSDDARVESAVDEFEAIARTLELGEKLKQAHRFDRLGLDAQMDVLIAALANGSAVEPGNIQAELQALATDDAVLERVRRKAATVLESVHAGAATTATP